MHAHFDCSKGVSGMAMLAACIQCQRDRLEQFDVQAQEFLEFFFGESRQVQDVVSQACHLDNQEEDGLAFTVVYEPYENPDKIYRSWAQVNEVLLRDESAALANFSASARSKVQQVVNELVLAEARAKEQLKKGGKKDDELDQDMIVEFLAPVLVSIVGVILFLDRMDVTSVTCSPLPLVDLSNESQLSSTCMKELLKGMPVTLSSDCDRMGLEDDGVALLRVLTGVSEANQALTGPSAGVSTPPPMQFQAMHRGIQPFTNGQYSMQMLLGTRLDMDPAREPPSKKQATEENLWNTSRMTLLEANIDDMTPEHLSFCVERLLEADAADAWVTPIIMKKGRAAHQIHCLCRPEQTKPLSIVLFRHSSTLGIRIQQVERAALRRTMETVQTPWKVGPRLGQVDVKVARLGDEVIKAKAEYEHCKEISLATDVPIEVVSRRAAQNVKAFGTDSDDRVD